MNKDRVTASIESSFRKRVRKNSRVHAAYLLVHSEKLSIDMNIAEGKDGMPAHPQQPYYIASVGKLFTSVLISILFEKGRLSFDDRIAELLDHGLLENLHTYMGKDYSNEIEIRHLLNHTSGLPDHFYPLLEKLLRNPDCEISPREVIEWSKKHLKPHHPPGTWFHYSDTNYHILGLIIEGITGMPFHDALKHHIFEPIGMRHSYVLHSSRPIEECRYPIADFYIGDVRLTDHHGYAGIDYSGGGMVATSEDLLRFMISLVKGQIIRTETFESMRDWAKYSFMIDYGYGLMRFRPIPLAVPKKYGVWGHAGATGSFMFYHPEMDAYLIGSFNQFDHERKGVRFMLKVVNRLSRCD